MALTRFTRRQPRITFPAFSPAAMPSFDDVESRMSRFIERALTDPLGSALPEPIGWLPPMDITETAEELTFTAELPGMDRKDIDVVVEDGVLTVRGEKLEERSEEEKKFHLVERSYGAFQRAFALPASVDVTKIVAEFDKSVLKVHLPKTAVAKANARRIEIQSGQ